MFTPVGHSVHRGDLVPGGMLVWEGAWSGGAWSGWWPVPGGWLVLGGCLVETPGRLLLRAVCILLECILVLLFFFAFATAFAWCEQTFIRTWVPYLYRCVHIPLLLHHTWTGSQVLDHALPRGR